MFDFIPTFQIYIIGINKICRTLGSLSWDHSIWISVGPSSWTDTWVSTSSVIPADSTVFLTHSFNGSSFKSSLRSPANSPPAKATGSYNNTNYFKWYVRHELQSISISSNVDHQRHYKSECFHLKNSYCPEGINKEYYAIVSKWTGIAYLVINVDYYIT